LFVFKPGGLTDFEKKFHDELAGHTNLTTFDIDGMLFGNGYAVRSDGLIVHQGPGLYYLRCDKMTEVIAEQLPADVPGCVFSNVKKS
jgi:hypothetical protein